MEMFRIHGGNPLLGEVAVSGSKNCSLPILIASLLCEGKSHLFNVPKLADTRFLLELLTFLGTKNHEPSLNKVTIDATTITQNIAPYDIVRKMRASVLVLAPLLQRMGEARVSLPGGCAIGSRPIDIHLNGLKALGAELSVNEGYVDAKLPKGHFVGAKIVLPLPSVGATEQLIMAAVLAKGDTEIIGAAREPEVVDLCRALNNASAKISGHGTSHILIQGVSALKPLDWHIAPDRIEAGTLMAAVAIMGGQVTIQNVINEDLTSLIQHFQLAGCTFKERPQGEGILSDLAMVAPKRLLAVNVETQAHPGFPTDMQAQFMAAMTTAKGTSTIFERIFENRMMHVPELNRLGAKITLHRGIATIEGQEELKGAPVMATDLRASASLVIAGLKASGTTDVRRIYHLDRGYESLEKKLNCLGANVERCQQDL